MAELLPRTGIIGEGKMGTNIFNFFVDLGFPVTWVVSPEADLEKIRRSFYKKLKRSLDSGIISEQEFRTRSELTTISSDVSTFGSSKLIIEAVTEDLQLKTNIFSELDRNTGPDCILATNSSSILPSQLIPSPQRKDKVIGIHFFYPVSLKNITELITTQDTSTGTITFVKQFLGLIGRDFLELNESNGFILNRMFLEFQVEAFHIVQEGKANILQLDMLVRKNFFPHGVFDFMDSVGIATMLSSVLNYAQNSTDFSQYLPLINRLKELNGQGNFYSDSSPTVTDLEAEKEEEIISRLKNRLREAIHRYTTSSGYPETSIHSALGEYFGIEPEWFCGL